MAPGTFVVRDADRGRLEALARELGLDFVGTGGLPDADVLEIREPRVGVYKSWVTSMPEGWTRWVLDEFEFRVDTLHDADLTDEGLAPYDVVILPDQPEETIRDGYPALTMPEAYTGGVGAVGSAALFWRHAMVMRLLPAAGEPSSVEGGVPISEP